MPVETALDIAGYLDADEHAVAATLTRASGSTKPVVGIFDDDAEEIDGGLSVGIEQTDPVFTTHTSKIGTFSKDDTLTIASVVYKIKAGLNADADGWLELELERQ